MLVDLVRIPTPDGCMLDGAWQWPEPSRPKSLPLDSICLIHGTGSNFYQSTMLEFLAEQFLGLGVSVLRINTRGHDGISTLVTSKGGIRLGAAFEIVDDCRHDLRGIVAWLKSRGGPRVGLVGHSLGAVKSLYATAIDPDLAPEVVVALSPPRLSYSWFCQSPKRDEFLESFHRAEAMVSEGRGGETLEVKVPMPMLIAAAGYVEKYGPDERYNFLPLVPRLKCPTLFLFGSLEVETSMAFQNLPDEVAALQASHPDLGLTVVPGADHFYTGVRPQVWAALIAGLNPLLRQ